jgi:ABC-type nitrate/sulfonate/bicarbonate transport system substrate-binding protein
MLGLIVLLQAITLAVSGPATSPEYLPIWVADGDGHFARERLRVTVRTTRSEVGAAEALAQGQADLAATSLEAVLRFGTREGQQPRLLLGLTAAPPVAVLVNATHARRVRDVADLAGLRIALSAPGAAEHSWLNVLLARHGLTPAGVNVVSVGPGGLERALGSGDAQAAAVPEPLASRLLAERRASLVADLRTPEAAERTLGVPTVSAAVFVRGERRPGERELAAFVRAVRAAQERLALGAAAALAERLAPSVVGSADEFAGRVAQGRGLHLPEARVTPERLEASIDLLRDQVPIPSRARVQLLPTGPVRTTPGR